MQQKNKPNKKFIIFRIFFNFSNITRTMIKTLKILKLYKIHTNIRITRCLNTNPLKNHEIEHPKFIDTKIPDEEEPEILDIYKERLKYSPLLLEENEDEPRNKFGDLNLNRGISGVFDIEDLVATLRHQQCEDIFVAAVPEEANYVDYMVVVSGRSRRHMQAIAQFVRRVFKAKRAKKDLVPILEGANSADWMAIDLGNIALHIFSRKARSVYDLDSLWALSAKYDEEFNKPEPVSHILEHNVMSLKDFEPAE